ncbi:MAG TPA: hypothetical protein VN682_01170 [Terriglobales bacterium]|nr:hypothetical protein [Terriglobales bacterium]
MMPKIRDVLLNQYIGAVMIGMIAAQAIMGLINTFVQAGAVYFAIRQSTTSVFSPPQFSWRTPITSIITVFLEFLACAILIRWLYGDQYQSSESEVPNNGKSIGE